jgi:hypothetical protein
MRYYARFGAALVVLVVCVAGARFAAASQGSQTMTNADVVRMVSIGLPDDVIVAAIRTAPAARFDTGADDLVALQNQKVSNAVIAAMRDRQASPAAGSLGRAVGGAVSKGKWEVEVHGGGAFGSNPTGGTGSLPPAGPVFVTSTLNSSRRASSWYFGDGAALMNAINASFPAGLFAASGRITPLDPVLRQQGATWGNSGDFGARVSRAISSRLSVEFTLDAATSQLKLTDALLAGVEASRASFISAWNDQTGLIRTGGGFVFTNSSVTSVATINDQKGRRLFSTGAMTFDFPARGRVVPYATAGAGVISNIGGSPSVTLSGNYRFTSLNAFFSPGTPFSPQFPVNETDTVTIRLVPASNHPFVSVFGGGIKVAGSSRWGVRADVRAYVSQNTVDVLVDATPQVTTATPAGVIASTLTPSIQFSNNPAITNQQSTLSGAPISGFKTFSSSGTPVQVSVSFGYFVRF